MDGSIDLFQLELRSTKASIGLPKLVSMICVHLCICSSEHVTFILALDQFMSLSGLISPEAAKWRGGLLILTVGSKRRPGSVKHRAALIRSDLRIRIRDEALAIPGLQQRSLIIPGFLHQRHLGLPSWLRMLVSG